MATIDHLPWRHDHWLKNPWELKAHDEHILVSIYEDDTGVISSKEMVADEDVPRICERTASPQPDTKWSLQLLLTYEEDVGVFHYPVPYSLDAVNALWSHWHIPYNYTPRHHSLADATMPFSPVLDDSAWQGFFSNSTDFTAVVVYNSLTQQTFGACLTPTRNNLDRLINRIGRCKNFASNPFFVHVSWSSVEVHDLRKTCEEILLSSGRVADTMGYFSEDGEQSLDQLRNLTQMPQHLNHMATRYGSLDFSRSIISDHLDQLGNQFRNLPKEYCPVILTELQEQITYLQQCTKYTEYLSRQGREAVQSMVQTVYATLQQRDNQLNHRYGADMRLITAITLIFLPGTFVATFFSTTFWDFSPDNRGTKVTYWVYLYFVVTIGLTLLVLVVWRKFSVLKRLAANMGQVVHRIPLLGRLIKKKRVDDEELGKKGD